MRLDGLFQSCPVAHCQDPSLINNFVSAQILIEFVQNFKMGLCKSVSKVQLMITHAIFLYKILIVDHLFLAGDLL